MNDAWVQAGRLADLEVGGARLIKAEGRQIALFRPERDALFAVDNLCPHEGYPLVQGSVRECLLTCAWHNFKFDLRDGRCVQGDEDVVRYDVEVRDGEIAIKVDEPNASPDLDRLRRSLVEGLLDDSLGRVARDAVRLLEAGVDPVELLWEAARFDAEHAEYGTTHALPVATDLLRWLPRYPGRRAALPIAQALECAADPNVRRAPRPVAPPTDPGSDPAAAGARLAELVEGEDLAGAEGLMRGALAAGWSREVIEPWLLDLCCEHFLSFGHALIYTMKAFDLLDRVGWDRADALLPALLMRIVTGTREDTLPPMRPVAERVNALAPRFAAWQQNTRQQNTSGELDRAALLAAVLDGTRHDATAAVEAALDAGATPTSVAGVLATAAAERLLRFDVGIDADPTIQEGWLDETHGLTFAHAVRHALARFTEPRALRLLFWAAHFVNRAKPLDLPKERRHRIKPRGCADPAEILDAVRAQRAGQALDLTAGYVGAGHDVLALRTAIEDLALDAPGTRPIVIAHVIKTTVVAFDETAALAGVPMSTHPALALVRLLASPINERRLPRLVHEAIRFVGDGKPPRRLT